MPIQKPLPFDSFPLPTPSQGSIRPEGGGPSLTDSWSRIRNAFHGRGPSGGAGTQLDLPFSQADKFQAGMRGSASARFGRYARGAPGRFAKGIRGIGPTGIAFDLAFAPVDMLAQGSINAARWAAKTGNEADYVGGFVFGATRAGGANIGATVGGLAGAGVGSAILPVGGTIVGGIIGGIGGYLLGETLVKDYAREQGRYFSSVAETGVAMRKVQFGSGFRDTREAFTMRQMAVSEMSGSLLNARQYLGNEGFFLHK